MKAIVKSFSSLVVIAGIGILSFTADARTPGCTTEILYNDDGTQCITCSSGGKGLPCDCGGEVCEV